MKGLSAIFLFLLMAGFAPAIVVEDYSIAANPPSGNWDLNWDFVYNYKESSAVAVGKYWLLTAAHVADDGGTGALTIDGTTYIQQEILVHAGADDPDNPDNADLALVRYDKPLPGYYDLYTGSFTTASEFIMVGFGNTGTVAGATSGPGPPGPPVPDYYTDSGTGRGAKRWGTQRFNYKAPLPLDFDSLLTTNEVFSMNFDLGDTEYEAGLGLYDSGGGSFIEDGGGWKLAGINVSRNGSDGEYTTLFAVSVPDYATWITQTMDSVTGDADSDGIPNWWEQQYATNVLADADQDGDGFDGEQEYIADTDPTDGSSLFTMEGAVTAAEQTFRFNGSTARQYQLLYTTNDLAAANLVWSTNGVPVWGGGPGSEIIVTNTEDRVFYRLEALLP